VFALGLAGAAVVAAHQAQVARTEELKAEKVNQFLNDMVSASSDYSFDPQKFTVAQMLEAAEARLERSWTGDPRIEATLRLSLGSSYLALMRFDRAKPQLERALAIFQGLGDEREVARSLMTLADLADAEGREADAVEGYERVLDQLKHLGKDAPPILIFLTKSRLASTLSLMLNRRLPEARTLLDEAIAIGNRDSSIPRTNLAQAMANRGMMLQTEGKRVEAEAMYRKSLAIGRQEDPNGFWQAGALLGLATLIAPRDHAGAAEISRQRYELIASHQGEDNAQTAIAKILWARQRGDAGELGVAATQVLEAMEIVRKHYPGSSMDRWFALSSSAHVLNQAKRYKEAESLAREMLPILEANHLPENDGRRGESLFELGKALHGQKKDREAREVLNQSATIYDGAGPYSAVMARLVRRELSEIK